MTKAAAQGNLRSQYGLGELYWKKTPYRHAQMCYIQSHKEWS
jgi:hypothetical protein